MESVAILVDVQNIYYTTRDRFNSHFDYNAFWRKATANRQVVEANAYAIASNNPKQRQFHHILRGIGFNVKLKPFIQRMDGSAKGDWDVGITLDAIEFAMQADVVILLSGDGDFDLLAQRIRDKYKKEVEVYGVKDLTAKSLIEASDRFYEIDEDLLIK
ncbi:LabA-like NYN domain-containing protein [Vibrio sp. VB16]|uniref:LabA-like NYN domain-containing protein n=1 Tax=Vibrio sp. VB16 TaxID=2785746 RepID=UPI0018A0EADD|nr:NYN domain-containing protein [Vibrio sp. VB16]UGA57132.1 NYN domain-containing protein [Vibrio sp. VB16]